MGGQGQTERTEWSHELCDLYRRQFNSLVRQARTIVQSQHLAEEATQDAFVKLRRHIAEVHPQRRASYLRSIVLNNARSIVRREQLRKKHARLASIPAASPEAHAVLADESRRLHGALEQLPRRQREVIRLRYLADYSEAQTAAALGIRPGSVKTHASRGRDSLRVLLAS